MQPRLAPPTPDPGPAAPERWHDVPTTSRALRHPLVLIAAVFFLSSLVTGPVAPGTPSAVAHWKLGPLYLGRPIAIWGDSPHYLVAVTSLIEDGDLDLRNQYDQARAGGWAVGTRFRGAALDRHVETDRLGRQLPFHSPFLPLLLASLTWPFRGTEWVESVCIWTTMAVTLWGLRCSMRAEGMTAPWLVALALATPLWVYARDISTEAYQATAWAALLVLQHPLAIAAVVIAGVTIKLPFAIVSLGLGAVAFARGERRRALVLIGASLVAIAIAIAATQYLFRDADHFNLFHLPGHETLHPGKFRARWKGFVGLALGRENGLLLFCPFLVLGLRAATKDARLWVPAAAFFLFHASYSGWRAGSGVSARYLIPMLPVLVIAVARARPRGVIPAALVAYSAIIATIAGVLPVAAFDKSPVAIFRFVAQRIGALFG